MAVRDLKLASRRDLIHYVQIQRSALRALRAIAKTPGGRPAHDLVIWMTETMDHRGALVASRKTMAHALGVSEVTIKRSIKKLVDERWIQRINLGPGTVGAYAVNARVAWAGPREKITKLAHFNAQVVAHLDDQEPEALLDEPLRQVPDIIPPELASILEDESPEDQLDLPGV